VSLFRGFDQTPWLWAGKEAKMLYSHW